VEVLQPQGRSARTDLFSGLAANREARQTDPLAGVSGGRECRQDTFVRAPTGIDPRRAVLLRVSRAAPGSL